MNTRPQYYWPLWKKLFVSTSFLFSFVFTIFVIIFIKIGSIFIKSWKGKEITWLFEVLVPLAFRWDYMWKKNPPSFY